LRHWRDQQWPKWKSKDLNEELPMFKDEPMAVDLVTRMLAMNPAQRPSARALLDGHLYLKGRKRCVPTTKTIPNSYMFSARTGSTYNNSNIIKKDVMDAQKRYAHGLSTNKDDGTQKDFLLMNKSLSECQTYLNLENEHATSRASVSEKNEASFFLFVFFFNCLDICLMEKNLEALQKAVNLSANAINDHKTQKLVSLSDGLSFNWRGVFANHFRTNR
ncbi:hypothetical protein RFI_21065, partial [Reticulomyxa filosa]